MKFSDLLNQVKGFFKSRNIYKFICSIGATKAIEEKFVLVEILPRSIFNIVSNLSKSTTIPISFINNSIGFQSINDAIMEAENVASGLLKYVKSEDLFFFFGETLESLQSALREFSFRNSIPYAENNIFDPIHKESKYYENIYNPHPLAIVLCKFINTEPSQSFFTTKQKKGVDCSQQYYEINWGEFQEILKCIKNTYNLSNHVVC